MSRKRTPRALIWMLYLYIISLPLFGFSLLDVKWQGAGVLRPDWVVGILLILLFGFYLVLDRVNFKWSSINTFVVFYLLTGVLSLFNLLNSEPNQLIDYCTKAVQLLFVTTVYFVISSLEISDKEIKKVLKIWFSVSTIVAAYAAYQLLARFYNWPFAYLIPTAALGGRQSGRIFIIEGLGELIKIGKVGDISSFSYTQVSSFFIEPTYLGSYLLSSLVFFGILVTNNRDQEILFTSSFWNQCFCLIIFLGLMLPIALGPYISLGVILLLLIPGNLIYRIRIRKIYFILISSILLGGLFFSLLNIDFLNMAWIRIGDLFQVLRGNLGDPTSFTVRLERISAALQVWMKHPIIGVGLNNTHYFLPEGMNKINSGWIQLLSGQGLIGFLSMVFILMGLITGLHKLAVKRGSGSWIYYVFVGLIFVILSDAVDTIITFNWTDPIRWFPLSLAHLLYLHGRKKNIEKQTYPT